MYPKESALCQNPGSQSDNAFQNELLSERPKLKSYAHTLCRNAADAEDLLQDALMKAWASRDSFFPGSNMRAWLRTILRNHFINDCRRRRHHVSIEDITEGLHAAVPPAQGGNLEVAEVAKAIEELCPAQSEVLLLAGLHELSMQEIADRTATPVGTVKTRLRKGRKALKLASCDELNVMPERTRAQHQCVSTRRSAAIAQWRAAKAANRSMIIG